MGGASNSARWRSSEVKRAARRTTMWPSSWVRSEGDLAMVELYLLGFPLHVPGHSQRKINPVAAAYTNASRSPRSELAQGIPFQIESWKYPNP